MRHEISKTYLKYSQGEVILISLATVDAAQAITFNAGADFSLTTNPNGVWQYGYSNSLGDSFNLYSDAINSFGLEVWRSNIIGLDPNFAYNSTANTIDPGGILWEPGKLSFHPGPNGQYSVLRWLAPSSGSFNVASTFTGLNYSQGTTTDVHVIYNGAPLFSDFINGFGDSKSLTKTLLVSAGDIIDFAVGIGSNGTYFSDTTGVDAIISSTNTDPSIPEPSSTLGLSVFATLGGCAWLKRKQQQKV